MRVPIALYPQPVYTRDGVHIYVSRKEAAMSKDMRRCEACNKKYEYFKSDIKYRLCGQDDDLCPACNTLRRLNIQPNIKTEGQEFDHGAWERQMKHVAPHHFKDYS